MINMMKAESYRLVRSKGFGVFWIVMLISYAITIITKEAGGVTIGGPMPATDSAKLDIRMVCMNFTYYFTLIAPVFSIITAEFSEHTVKNTISSAVSKKEYYLSKYVFTMLCTLVMFLLANLMYYGANAIVNGSENASQFGEYFKAVMMQMPLVTAIVSAFIFLAFFFRKGAAFNSVSIMYPFIYSAAALIYYSACRKGDNKLAVRLLNYEISTMFSKLALGGSSGYVRNCIILCAVVTVVSFVLGYLSFTKREID